MKPKEVAKAIRLSKEDADYLETVDPVFSKAVRKLIEDSRANEHRSQRGDAPALGASKKLSRRRG
jgi:hypothetical protein